MSVIDIKHLTRDYGNKKGIFDVSFSIEKGEVFGFLGPNGAGKTTTIRHLMGFIYAKEGECLINDLNCGTDSSSIQKNLGYIPGEINFSDDLTGIQFIQFMARYRGMKNMDRAHELIKMFELDPRGKIKKMSKGMKQKIAIVCAFMHDPQVLILDEPSSGLDPLMQNRFVELVLQEKQKGKTILMSSHMFEEVEKTCDRIGIIKEGHLVSVENTETMKHSKQKTFVITFASEEEAIAFTQEKIKFHSLTKNQVSVTVSTDINPLISILSHYKVEMMDILQQTLEEAFMHFYGGDRNE